MREQVGAQRVHDALAGAGREPGLHDAEELGHDGDGEDAADEREQERDVLVGDGVVDEGLGQERRGEADDRGEDDEPEHDGHGQRVRGEESRDAREGDGVLVELGEVGLADAQAGAVAAARSRAAEVGGDCRDDHVLREVIW